jgi:hypothetical protein
MRTIKFPVLLVLVLAAMGCSENYANGERIGMVTRFTRKGIIWKSWEGSLNLTQTGMNTSGVPFDFSVDNDHEDPKIIAMVDSAASLGWKVKLTYHETYGKNWFENRGSTNHFIKTVEVLDRSPVGFLQGNSPAASTASPASGGHVVDTVYVVIVGKASEGFKPGK